MANGNENNAGDPKKQKQINDLLNTASGMMKNFGIEGEQAAKVMDQILKGGIKNNAVLVEELKLLKQVASEYQTIAGNAASYEDISEGINKLVSEQASIQNNLTDYTRDRGKALKQNIQAMRKQVQASAMHGDITMETKQVMMEQLNTISQFEDYTSKWGAASEEALNTLHAGTDKLTGFAEGFMEKIPGGKMLSKMIGLDQANGIIKKGLNAGMGEFVGQMAKGANKTQALNAALKVATRAIGPQGLLVLGVLAKVAALAAAAAAVYAVFKALQKVTQEALKFADTTGLSVAQSKELVMQSYELQASQSTLLATAKEIRDVQAQFIDQFGRADILSGETAAKVADIGKAFGYGSKVAGEVQMTLMEIGGASEETAANMQIVANEMSQAMGVAPGKVMKDLAKNGGLLAKSMAGNAKQMVKTAAYAASIGLDIEKMVKATDGLLNIEESLTSQMEYQAISGKTINMEKARYLKAIGDEEGAMKEMTKQLEMQGDISKMSPIARQKLADLYGMEIGDLMRINTLNQKAKDMTAEQAELVKKYGDKLGDISNLEADQIVARATQVQMTERLAAMFGKVKAAFMSALAPLMDIMNTVIEDMMPAFKMIGSIFNAVIITPIKQFGILLKMIYTSVIQPLVKAFDPLREALSDMFDTVSGEGTKTFQKLTDIVGKVLAPIFKVIGFTIKNFIVRPIAFVVKIFTEIFKIVSSVLQGILTVGGAILDFLLAPFNAVFDVISSVFDGIYDIAYGALTAIGDTISGLYNTIYNAIAYPFEFVAGIIGNIGGAIKNFIMAPINLVKGAVANVGETFKSFIQAPIEFVKGIIDSIKEAFFSLVETIQNIGQSIVDFILLPLKPFMWLADLFGGGGDDVEVNVNEDDKTKEATSQAPDATISDGIVTSDGTVVKTSPDDNFYATKNEISPMSPEGSTEGAPAGGESGGGILSKLSNAASTAFSMTPMGMAANAVGSLFGGGDDTSSGGGSNAELKAAIDKLNNILEGGIMAKVSADQAATAVNEANSYKI